MIEQKDLKALRAKAKLTQREFSGLIHCACRTYQRYEALSREMPIYLLDLLQYKLHEKGFLI